MLRSKPMQNRRAEALRRLGGPYCPTCDTVGAEDVEARWVTPELIEWLQERGRGALVKESLAPMCRACFRNAQDSRGFVWSFDPAVTVVPTMEDAVALLPRRQ